MSRSEQLPDASMEEILASIRKIITDDGPEAPDPDAFSSAALDDFREASAALARGRPSGSYMHDLTRALAGGPPAAAEDDDILDDDPPPVAASALHTRSAPPGRTPAPAAAVTPHDDADLFEPEAVEPAGAAGPEDIQTAPVPVETVAEEEIIEDLGEPITLGPEIELVVEDEAEPEVMAQEIAPAEPPVAEPVQAAVAVAPAPSMAFVEEIPAPAAEASVEAVPPPPPPPPVISTATEDEATVESTITEDASDEVSEPIASQMLPPEIVAEAVAALTPHSDLLPAEPAPVADVPIAVEAQAEMTAAAAEAEVAQLEPIAALSEAASKVTAEMVPAMEFEPPAIEAPTAEDVAASAAELVAAAVGVAPAVAAEAPAQPAAQLPLGEDAMAAMLKPMLKEWLDANMPRIVAKVMSGTDEPGTPAA